MILRELHIHERKSAVPGVDARDESVMGHNRFSSASSVSDHGELAVNQTFFNPVKANWW
jgi:hypothetical protein